MFDQLYTTRITCLDDASLKKILFEILLIKEKFGEAIVEIENDKIILSDPDNIERCIFVLKSKYVIENVSDKQSLSDCLSSSKFNVLNDLK